MSFSFSVKEMPAADAAWAIDNNPQVPLSVSAYVRAGIEALERRYEGKDILVDVTAYGHLFTGEDGNYETTSATVSVSRSVPE